MENIFEDVEKSIRIYNLTRIYKIIYLIIFIVFVSNFYKKKDYHFINDINMEIKVQIQKNKIIEENFFVFDSNNLEEVETHLYGFSVSEKGILTNNYLKHIGLYEDIQPTGIYILIKVKGDEIKLIQDYHGSYGLYIYENKETKYFALSNSFLLLEEYLIGKQNLSFNKDFADNLIISELCTFSLDETLIKEITQVPSDSYIVINKKSKTLNIYKNKCEENTIPLESKEGLKLIDKWVDKWGYIIRSLIKKTNNISFDLSGGFDTRTLLSILLNSGINMKEILINSFINKEHGHDEDSEIATNISRKFKFKLNALKLDNNITKWGIKDSIFSSIYSKLGFHKEFYLKNFFYNKPRFSFTGHGGEDLRGAPGYTIYKYLEKISSRDIKNLQKEFFNSSIRLLNKSISSLLKEKRFNNEYEIASSLYSKALDRNHFGKTALEAFNANMYVIQPLLDPVIKKIKYDINGSLPHDLISYIYIRFAHNLVNFSFQGNRTINLESVRKAKILNKQLTTYEIKSNYNKNFYIDLERISPVKSSTNNKNLYEYLKEFLSSYKFIKIINKLYSKYVYDWANSYSVTSNFYPLRHKYGLLAIAITLENLSKNSTYFNELNHKNNFFDFER